MARPVMIDTVEGLLISGTPSVGQHPVFGSSPGTASWLADPVNPWIGSFDPRLGANTTTAAATNNVPQYMKMQAIFRSVPVTKAYFRVGTAAGNLDICLFSSDGTTMTRIAATGSFACPAAGSRNQAFAAGVTLNPGIDYWCSLNCSDISSTFLGFPSSAHIGTQRFAGDGDSATFPTPATQVIANLGGNARAFILTFE